MKTKAIATCFHRYQPYGEQYYAPIYDFYISSLTKYRQEFDKVYIFDSNWNIKNSPDFVKVINVDPNLRYYDVYRKYLDQIEEDYVLLTDNDTVIYREGTIRKIFDTLALHAVSSIFDTIGEFKTDKMNGKNKLCPYLFAAQKDVLMKYRDVEWGDDMPYCETLGHLTEAILKDGIVPYELEEDKSSLYFNYSLSKQDKGKDLGYMHIGAGSTPAVLLAWREYDQPAYWEYLKNQPRTEYMRQMCWYNYMGGNISDILADLEVGIGEWLIYYQRFKNFHNLP